MIRASQKRIAGTLVWGLAGLCALALIVVVTVSILARAGNATSDAGEAKVRLLPGSTNTLLVHPSLITSLGVRTAQVEPAASHEHLQLSGTTFLDSNRMARIHGRFGGEVVTIGPNIEGAGAAAERPLRLGDHVKKNQLLAIIWSKDVGEKKSDLVDALSQSYLDKLQLDRLQSLAKGIVRDADVRQAERTYEQDVIAVQRIDRTLRSWRLTEAEIDEIKAEAERIHQGDLKTDKRNEKSWAEVEVRSPLDGIVLEKNIAVGDIVDTSLELFKVADMTTVGVLANVYEEDLPALEALGTDNRRWKIHLRTQPDGPGTAGSFDTIGSIIDPNQHTAAVMGWLNNGDGRLRAGQFITATVDLPAKPNEVAVPDGSVIEAGTENIIFVAADRTGEKLVRRNVAVVRRSDDYVYIHALPTAEEKAQGCEPLKVGEWVVTSGTIELAGAMEDALALAPVQENLSK